MNTYLIIFLSYLGAMFLLGFIPTWFYLMKDHIFHKIETFFMALILWLLFLPIGIIAFPLFIYANISNEDITIIKKYKRTIHELTENNKITLRQLGFEEGHFISNANLDYDGFRYDKGSIIVCYNGRITVFGNLKKKQKLIYDLIVNLPNDIEPKTHESNSTN